MTKINLLEHPSSEHSSPARAPLHLFMILHLTRPIFKAACSSFAFRHAIVQAPSQLRKLSPLTPFATFATMANTLPTDRRPLVISGPSGVGKGTLFALLRERHPDTFTLSVSHTTRAPREGESHGEHYYFVTHDDFTDLIAKDGFVEHAQFSGNRYGTSKQTIKDQTEKGKVVVLDIEMEGVKQIKQSGMEARYVFVAPPSEDELEKRLRGRGTEKEESVQKRLKQAKLELEYSRTPGVHDLIVSGHGTENVCFAKKANIYIT